MNPSIFKLASPMGSLMQKAEAETVAQNIIVILARTGDTWRDLIYEEYKQERIKDGDYSSIEELYFNEVIGYCKSPETARLFAPDWNKVYKNNKQKNEKS